MKKLKWGAWGLLVLVLLAIVAWTIANVTGEAKFRAALDTLRAAGYATSAVELAPKPIPAAENAAPYYTAAFALAVPPAEEDQDALYGPGGWGALDDGRKASLRACVDANAEAFELLEKARKRARCAFERDYAKGLEILLPEVTEILKVSRLLRLRAAVQPDSARRSAEAVIALAGTIADERILISQLVRLTVLEIACEIVDDAVTAEASEADLKAWLEIVPRSESLTGVMAPALRGELAMVADLLREPADRFWTMVDTSRAGDIRLLTKIARPWFKSDGARYLELMRRAAEAAAQSYLDGRAEIAAVTAKVAPSVWRPVTTLLLPALGHAVERGAVTQARLAVTRAGLEAELARRTSGRYPAQVQGTDPFTGKPPAIDAARVSSAWTEKIEWRLRAK
ncbi:MAG TPA: hypothetical protein VF950_06080 [Planctomycetota bacterium]